MRTVEIMPKRLLIADTDQGKDFADRILDLNDLVEAFKTGQIKEIY